MYKNKYITIRIINNNNSYIKEKVNYRKNMN